MWPRPSKLRLITALSIGAFGIVALLLGAGGFLHENDAISRVAGAVVGFIATLVLVAMNFLAPKN